MANTPAAGPGAMAEARIRLEWRAVVKASVPLTRVLETNLPLTIPWYLE